MEEVVLFSHDANLYAIDASLVEEILEPLPVTLLPINDEHAVVDGLINVHGKVVLQFNFQKILKKYAPPVQQKISKNKKAASLRPNNILLVNLDEHTSSQRAIYVGEVIGKVKTDPSKIHHIENDAVYKGHFLYKKQMAILLNLGGINEIAALRTKHPSWNIAFGKPISVGEKSTHFNTPRYLLVKIKGMVYGVDTVDIDELILLGDVTHIPFLPDKVLGLVNLRNSPMITVSLPSIIHEGLQEIQYNYGIVVKNNVRTFILAVEELLKIEQFPPHNFHLLKKQDGEIKAWAKTEYSDFIPIIDIAHIFDSPLMQEIEPYLQPSQQDPLMSYVSDHEKRFLITLIEDEYYGIPLESIKIIVDHMTLQSLPPHEKENEIKGITQIHGEIIYVVDTKCLLQKKIDVYKNYVVILANNRSFVLPIQNVDMVMNIPESRQETINSDDKLIQKIAKVDKKLISIINTDEIVERLPKLGGAA